MIILLNFGANKKRKIIHVNKFVMFPTKMMLIVSGLKKQTGISQWQAVQMMPPLKSGKYSFEKFFIYFTLNSVNLLKLFKERFFLLIHDADFKNYFK